MDKACQCGQNSLITPQIFCNTILGKRLVSTKEHFQCCNFYGGSSFITRLYTICSHKARRELVTMKLTDSTFHSKAESTNSHTISQLPHGNQYLDKLLCTDDASSCCHAR